MLHNRAANKNVYLLHLYRIIVRYWGLFYLEILNFPYQYKRLQNTILYIKLKCILGYSRIFVYSI